jgi:tripartite-type tricarboxylate transporter receptor subunit TctC
MRERKSWIWVGLVFILTIAVLAGWNKNVQSQEKYPTRAIEVVCPWAPGGGTDTTARLAAGFMKQKWGVPVNVVNKTGGLGLTGTMEVQNSSADGYTILADVDSTSYLLTVAVEDAPLDVMNRTFLSIVTVVPYVFMVPSTSPHKTLADLMAEAKKDPEKFNYAVGGINQDLVFRQLFNAFGFDNFRKAQIIRTKGGAESTVLAAGGHVKVGTTVSSTCRAAVAAGTVRLLAITSTKRDPGYPDVPTTTELGYPSVDLLYWVGFSGPPKLASHIVKAWEDVSQEILKDPTVLTRLKTSGTEPFYKGSVEFKEMVSQKMVEAKKMFGLK